MRGIVRQQRGFTLIELMLTLAVAAVLTTVALPSLADLLARTRSLDYEASIADTLRQARATAVLRNQRVLVCPSSDGRRCATGFDWRRGWIVGADADHDGQPDPEAPLLASLAVAPHGTNVVTSSGRSRIVFQPTGSAGGSNARFTVCHAHARKGRSVIIANSGRVRLGPPEPDRLAECLAGAAGGP